MGGDEDDCGDEEESIGDICEPEEGDGRDGFEPAVGEFWGFSVVW